MGDAEAAGEEGVPAPGQGAPGWATSALGAWDEAACSDDQGCHVFSGLAGDIGEHARQATGHTPAIGRYPRGWLAAPPEDASLVGRYRALARPPPLAGHARRAARAKVTPALVGSSES